MLVHRSVLCGAPSSGVGPRTGQHRGIKGARVKQTTLAAAASALLDATACPEVVHHPGLPAAGPAVNPSLHIFFVGRGTACETSPRPCASADCGRHRDA